MVRVEGSQWQMTSVPIFPETSISLAITTYSVLSIRSPLAHVMSRDLRLKINDCSTSLFLLFLTSTWHPWAWESALNSQWKHRAPAASPRMMSCRVPTVFHHEKEKNEGSALLIKQYIQDGICCNIVHDITCEVVDTDRVLCEGRHVSRRKGEPGQLEMGGVQVQHCHIVWRAWKRPCRQQDHVR